MLVENVKCSTFLWGSFYFLVLPQMMLPYSPHLSSCCPPSPLTPSNANPWWRRYYHLRHHQYAGQVVDVEERLIGLGLPWYSWKRILVTFTPAATLLIANDIAKDDPEFS